MHHAILYISLLWLHPYDMKLPNFTCLLYGVGEHSSQKLSFSSSKLRYCPFGFNPKISPTFAKLNEIE